MTHPRSDDTQVGFVDVALGYLTGLRFLAPYPLDPLELIATALVVNTCDAMMCRLFARNNGYPVRLWTILGFIFGLWAVIVFILLPRRAGHGTEP